MAGQTIVLHFWWTEGSTTRQETYGPWEAREDDSHLERITGFVKDWQQATGCMPSSVTMAIVTTPEQFAEEIAEREEYLTLATGHGVISASEAQGLPRL
jgi:hypothetical protein